MAESIIVAVISGGFAVFGTVVTCLATGRRTEHHIQVSQAVTESRLDELTREVREHNGFARRMPVVEEQIKVINHRISDLERGQKGI